MLYIERDELGNILALRKSASSPDQESKPANDSEILDFLNTRESQGVPAQTLVAMDLESIRIIEDLVDVLIAKGVLMITDLPEAAQEKLQERKQVRQEVGKAPLLVKDIL
jgi:hypothetical protein